MSLQGYKCQNIEAEIRPPSTPSTSTSQDCMYDDEQGKKKKRSSHIVSSYRKMKEWLKKHLERF